MTWFHIAHTCPGESPTSTAPLEVQILDKDGQAAKTVYFTQEEVHDTAADFEIPAPVRDKLAKLPVGFGHYVDSDGSPLDLWGNLITEPDYLDRDRLAATLLMAAERLTTMPSPCIDAARSKLHAILEHYSDTSSITGAESFLERLEAK